MATKPQKHERKMSTRAVAGMPTTVDAESRSFDIIITTEAPARTWIYDQKLSGGMEADEVLLASGLDMSRAARMPLMDTHDTYSGIDKILGKVDDVRVEGTQIVGRATLTSGRAALVQDIAEGFYGQVSAGYVVDEYEIEMRAGTVPLAYATKWTLHEASLVPVGLDPNASVRAPRTFPAPKVSVRNLPKETQTMDELETAVVAAETAIEALDAAVVAAGETADEALVERARKLRAEGDAAPTDEEKKKEEEAAAAAAEAARSADDEPLTADEQKKEDEEVRSIRSVAATYGLGKTVDDLVKLGARAKDIKVAVRAAVLKRGATPAASTAGLKPQTERSAPAAIDTAAIFARRNKR